MSGEGKLAVLEPKNSALVPRVMALAKRLGLPMSSFAASSQYALLLGMDGEGLFLCAQKGQKRDGKVFRIDFTKLDVASQTGRSMNQPLVRAVQGKKRYDRAPLVLDCSGGFGQDSWLLASLGHLVICMEKNPVVFALLQDAWSRAGVVNRNVAVRMRLYHGDSREILALLDQGKKCVSGGLLLARPDVALFDPMFPAKRRAKQKRAMCLLQTIVGPGDEQSGDQQVLRALRVVRTRVVVKRPRKGASWTNFAPDHQLLGRGVRYDIYCKGSVRRFADQVSQGK